MTTIACDPRTMEMSGDTQINSGGTITYGPKVLRLKDGSLFGAAGDCKQIRRLALWLNNGRIGRRPRITEVDALWLLPNGELWCIDSGWPPIKCSPDKPCAVGNGDQAALAAMVHFRANTREAIKAASAVSSSTGGRITTLRLRKKQSPTAPK